MLFLPSLLEYQTLDLENKLLAVSQKINKFKELQQSVGEELNFHLDFVLPEFALSRGVAASLDLQTVFETLAQSFREQKLHLTIHLMGKEQDLAQAYQFFSQYVFLPGWKYTIFLPESFTQLFQDLSGQEGPAEGQIRLGIWYDLQEWIEGQSLNFSRQAILLMTVKAGLSGQKLEPEIKEKALSLVEQNPQVRFVLDGGWEVDFQSSLPNLSLVSYSSFWRAFAQV